MEETKFPIIDKDNNGKVIHRKWKDGPEDWLEYDKENRISRVKSVYPNTYTIFIDYEYTKTGSILHFRNSKNYEFWQEYDKNNKIIGYKDSETKGVSLNFNLKEGI